MMYDKTAAGRLALWFAVTMGSLTFPIGATAAPAPLAAAAEDRQSGTDTASPSRASDDTGTPARRQPDDADGGQPRKRHGHSHDDDGVIRRRPDVYYDWHALPRWHKVSVKRAWFDLNGYEMVDSAGNGIIVPFGDRTTYVMKFCLATGDDMSIENQGNYPVLYLPIKASIKNATVPRAHWYPLTSQFHPSAPVFLSMVPTWDAFVDMPWFPGMDYYGGYWSGLAFSPSSFLPPTAGLAVTIKTYRCDGWDAYQRYCGGHADSVRTDRIENMAEEEADAAPAGGQ